MKTFVTDRLTNRRTDRASFIGPRCAGPKIKIDGKKVVPFEFSRFNFKLLFNHFMPNSKIYHRRWMLRNYFANPEITNPICLPMWKNLFSRIVTFLHQEVFKKICAYTFAGL